MLKPPKKIKKRELKEDRLVLTYYKVREFIESNRKVISYAITGVIILIIAGIIYRNNLKAENERAETLLSKVIRYYDTGDYKTAIDGIPQRNIQGLRYIAENYSGTEAGALAAYYLANAYFALGDYDNAMKYFREYDGDDPMLIASTLAGIAAIYEVKGEYAKAAEYFEKAALVFPDNILVPEYLYNSARNYRIIGRFEKALRLYERVKKDYPNSEYVRYIDIYIASLRGE